MERSIGDQNNLPGSHNQPTNSQQQNFGAGGGYPTVVQEQQRVAQPCLKQKTSLQWTPELNNCFLHAVHELGGPDRAKPKAILEKLAISWLTKDNVKSRLQTLRQLLRQGRLTDIWGSGPGMGDQNVGGNLETGTVTTPSYSAQQQYQVDVADISAVHEGRFMTSNGYPFPGPYNNPTSSTAINNVQADLQFHTLGFLDQNGTFYPFQPGNGNHLVRLVQYCEALQNNQQQNPPQAATDTVQAQTGIYNFQFGNEANWVQQSALDGGTLGNIQQQNQAQAATDTVQAQNATTDFEIADMFLEPLGLARQNEVYNIQAGNETQMVQQPAQDGEALGNNQQQNQPQAATDNVQAQNATPYNMETTEEWMGYFDWYRYSNQELEDF